MKKYFAWILIRIPFNDLRGISKTQGALLIVRPDQHVAEVLALDDTAGLITFFDAVLLDAH